MKSKTIGFEAARFSAHKVVACWEPNSLPPLIFCKVHVATDYNQLDKLHRLTKKVHCIQLGFIYLRTISISIQTSVS